MALSKVSPDIEVSFQNQGRIKKIHFTNSPE